MCICIKSSFAASLCCKINSENVTVAQLFIRSTMIHVITTMHLQQCYNPGMSKYVSIRSFRWHKTFYIPPYKSYCALPPHPLPQLPHTWACLFATTPSTAFTINLQAANVPYCLCMLNVCMWCVHSGSWRKFHCGDTSRWRRRHRRRR